MKTKTRFFSECIPVVGALLTVGLVSCTPDDGPSYAGGVTETENCQIDGYVYNPNGSPAGDATVRFYRADYNPTSGGGVAESVMTNHDGYYSVGYLPTDTYNILATGDSGVAFQGDLMIDATDSTRIPNDTLRAPGSLHGMVRLAGGEDSRTILIIVFGTSSWGAPSDSDGNFSLSDLPGGTYDIRFLTTLDKYAPLDTQLTITAGMDRVLSDTIMLWPKNSVPSPEQVTVTFDSVSHVVALSWDATDGGEYMVYRRHADSSFALKPLATIGAGDSVYRDSSAIHGEIYQYAVRSTSDPRDPSELTLSQVEIVPNYELVATYGKGSGGNADSVAGIAGIAVGPTGTIYCLDQTHNEVHMLDSSGTWLGKFGGQGSGPGQLQFPSDIAVDSSGDVYVVEVANRRVQRFGSDGVAKGLVGETILSDPRQVACDRGMVGIWDALKKKVFLFNSQSLEKTGEIAFEDVFAMEIHADTVFFATMDRIILYSSSTATALDTFSVKRCGGSNECQIRSLATDGKGILCALTESGSQCRIERLTLSGSWESSVQLPVSKGILAKIAMSGRGDVLVGFFEGTIDKYRFKR